jgi:hypothetical protein
MDAGEMEDVRAAAAAEQVISTRGGSVLGKKTILKSDHFPGCQNKRLSPQIDGAPNYRQVGSVGSFISLSLASRLVPCYLPRKVTINLASQSTSSLWVDGWWWWCLINSSPLLRAEFGFSDILTRRHSPRSLREGIGCLIFISGLLAYCLQRGTAPLSGVPIYEYFYSRIYSVLVSKHPDSNEFSRSHANLHIIRQSLLVFSPLKFF